MKRKSLVDRAGEVGRTSYNGRPGSRQISAAIKASNMDSFRQASTYGSSGSSRLAASSRSGSSASITSSVSASARLTPTRSSRPQSALGNGRLALQPPSTASRPSTQIQSPGSSGKRTITKRKGMPNLNPFIHVRKQRKRSERLRTTQSSMASKAVPKTPLAKGTSRGGNGRDISIVTGMQQLSLQQEMQRSPMPTYIPTAPSARAASPSRLPSPARTRPGHHSTTIHNMKKPLLKKCTDKRLAWDTKGRLEDVEQLYGDLKDEFQVQTNQFEVKMEKATTEKATLQEFVEMYKSRGELLVDVIPRVSPGRDSSFSKLTIGCVYSRGTGEHQS